MKKHLVNSEKEYISLFSEFEINDAENFLNVEFAYEDGTYQSDFTFDGTNPDNEDQDIDMLVYRKLKDAEECFPKEYPCIVLLANEKEYDRIGVNKFQMLEFIYINDFKLKA